MHDTTQDHDISDHDSALTAALRALPASEPPGNAWPALAARARRRRLARRAAWIGLPAALAAGIAIALAWPHAPLRAPAPAAPAIAQHATSTTVPAAELAALQANSRQWQAWVAALDADGAPLGGNALATSVALQDRIGLVDLQLSAARDPATAAALWRQRIELLQQLGWLHVKPYAVARGTRGDGTATTPM